MGRLGVVLAVALALLAASAVYGHRHAAPSARAAAMDGAPPPDSNAPPGAGPNWLPNEAWVMSHWLPYRESALYRVLQTDRETVRLWLLSRPLAELAQRKGLRVGRLVRTLMAPWRGGVSARRLSTLRTRALRTFSQRHLLQHMLFHPFHSWAFNRALPGILGVDRATMLKLAAQGVSFATQAERAGRSFTRVRQQLLTVLSATARQGVRRHEMLPAESREELNLQRTQLDSILLNGPVRTRGAG